MRHPSFARALRSACLLLLLHAVGLAAVPFWGAEVSRPPETAPAALASGEFVWDPAASPAGPIVVIASLDEQRAYVYRNGIRIGVATTSTGKPGHATPTGIFTVLQKDKSHRSKTYNNAPMPYAERLTWGGVALHAGGLPGYPSSHGCIHLPSRFAEALFAVSPMGMTVVIVDGKTAPQDVVHPGAFSPVDAKSGTFDEEDRLALGEEFRWQPERAPDGPVSILMSAADRRVLVFRNGIEIGRARIVVKDGRPLGTHAFIVAAGTAPGPNPLVSGAPLPRWTGVSMPGHFDDAGRALPQQAADRIAMPDAFARNVHPLLVPGTTMLVTDATVLAGGPGTPLTVLSDGPPT